MDAENPYRPPTTPGEARAESQRTVWQLVLANAKRGFVVGAALGVSVAVIVVAGLLNRAVTLEQIGYWNLVAIPLIFVLLFGTLGALFGSSVAAALAWVRRR